MDGQLTFRRAARDDLPRIVSLLADDPLGATRETAGEALAGAYVAAFEQIDANPRDLLLVALDGGEIVGTMQITLLHHLARKGATRAQIEAVRVAGDRRGEGVGRAMFLWAIDYARGHGAHIMQLTTDKRRQEAHRFYAALGFEASHEGMKLYLTGPTQA